MLAGLTKPGALRPPAPPGPPGPSAPSLVPAVIGGVCCGLVAAALGAIVMSPTGRDRDGVHAGYVTAKRWERAVTVEAPVTVVEEGWELPEGARVLSSRPVVRSYRAVPDGWVRPEDFERVARRLPGDTGRIPIAVERPIGSDGAGVPSGPLRQAFRHEPVAATRYRYEVERWERVATLRAEGNDELPAWPEAPLAPGQRVGNRRESYELSLMTQDGRLFRARVESRDYFRVRMGNRVPMRVLYGSEAELLPGHVLP